MLPHKGFRANSPSLCLHIFFLDIPRGGQYEESRELGASALLPFLGLWRSWERA